MLLARWSSLPRDRALHVKTITRSCIHGALATLIGILLGGSPARADPVALKWPQPGGPGTDVFITYSFSNLLDGSFAHLSVSELRAATEEALALWASHAPLHFRERPDSGPPPSDDPYDANGHPHIRIGYLEMDELAQAYFPGSGGLAGDVHFDPSVPWILAPSRWNFLEAITHELGHALGLAHELDLLAILNPVFPEPRFGGLGTAFLLPADIAQLQSLYGSGIGSVEPVPEPGTMVLVGTGIVVLGRLARRGRAAGLLVRRQGRRGPPAGSS